MKKITLLIAVFSFFIVECFAQKTNSIVTLQSGFYNPPKATQRNCATMGVYHNFIQKNPGAKTIEDFTKEISPVVNDYLKSTRNGEKSGELFAIPVIVHIIHNSSEAVGQGRNIPYTRVLQQIQVLNEDFRRTNSNADATWSQAADTEIEFRLITNYPSGHPQAGQLLAEPGVDRVDATTLPSVSNTVTGYSEGQIDANIKPLTSWNPSQVMNLWVTEIAGNVLGYAQLPSTGAANTDGVVISYQYFGFTGGQYGLGRTGTHEVGHYLGLYHIWGDDEHSSIVDKCLASDQIADTPNQAINTSGCPSGVRTDACSSTTPGYMYQNYMDYTDDACMNLFTNGQKVVMHTVLITQPRRSTLNAACATLCGNSSLKADFTRSNIVISAGQSIVFTDASTGPNPITKWAWDFDVTNVGGVSASSANTQGAHVVRYNNEGTFTVSLQVTDNIAVNDTEIKTADITVNPFGTKNCDLNLANWNIATHIGVTGTYTWSGNNGYLLGQNNNNGANGWADKIIHNAPGMELTDVFYYFGVAKGSGNINVKVWGESVNLPDNGNVMAQKSIAISSLATDGTPTIYSLATPVALSSNFYVGFDHTTLVPGDTAALMSASTGTGSTLNNETSGWVNLSTYSLDHSMAIIPVVCNIVTGEKEILGEVKDILVFPNPSLGTLNIALTSKHESTVEIYNLVGKLVYNNNLLNTQLVSVDISNHPDGVYFVKVRTEGSTTTKKVILSR